jgi:hypothetical protein
MTPYDRPYDRSVSPCYRYTIAPTIAPATAIRSPTIAPVFFPPYPPAVAGTAFGLGGRAALHPQQERETGKGQKRPRHARLRVESCNSGFINFAGTPRRADRGRHSMSTGPNLGPAARIGTFVCSKISKLVSVLHRFNHSVHHGERGFARVVATSSTLVERKARARGNPWRNGSAANGQSSNINGLAEKTGVWVPGGGRTSAGRYLDLLSQQSAAALKKFGFRFWPRFGFENLGPPRLGRGLGARWASCPVVGGLRRARTHQRPSGGLHE